MEKIRELQALCADPDSGLKGDLWVSPDGEGAVYTARSAGFCFGVQRAVDTVYEQIREGKRPIYTYGPIIHNEIVVGDLEKKGVRVIGSEEELRGLTEGTVIIRSHGVSREVYRILEKPYCALSSDAGEYAPGEGHPQVAGSFARFFHQMVIVRRKMTLPQAIAKVTLFPAKLFRLSGKGRLRESADADLVVFDPASYRDTAWFGGSDGVPDRMAEGVKMVFVNGKPAFAEGKVLNAQAGRLLTVRNVR